MDDSLPALKILMIGPSGAGKSALLIRYTEDQFDSESSTATIGVDFKTKKLNVRGTSYRLNLLDTAGQERFRTLSNSYYRGALGVILVYDISNRDSFLAMERWFEEAESNLVDGAKMCLVGSKSDKAATHRTVTYEEGQALASRHGCPFCEVSAKMRDNVKTPFLEVVDSIVKDQQLMNANANSRRGGTVRVNGDNDGGLGSGCAC